MPAATAAYQGELFYGVKGAVQGFSFRERASGRIVRTRLRSVWNRHWKSRAKSRCSRTAVPTSTTIPAGLSRLTPARRRWAGDQTCALQIPWSSALLILSNLYSFVCTAVLLAVELVLAIVDFVRGLIDAHDLLKELKFVPTRVAVSILLRDLANIGAMIDIARGLPIIHLNLLGYDEQAHRRGPSSLFANWTLKGIDDAVARIWRAPLGPPSL